MINPNAEIARLRHYLGDRGWMPSEIEEITDLASNDINEVMLDIVANAVAEATDYAVELGAEDFVEDMDVVEVGGGFIISTRSGKTDYSIPARHMLPDLLKNGEVSEDGSKYKVIPVGARKTISQPKDIFSALRSRQSALDEARASLVQNNLDKRSARAQNMASHFRSIMSRKMEQLHSERRKVGEVSTGSVDFRTASEKQDPQTDWVIPAKEMDMTGYLMDMNRRIEDSMRSSILFIVDSYIKEFA